MNDTPENRGTKMFHIVNGTWGHKKIKLKNKFGHLNDDDLYFAEGLESELIVRLMAKLNVNEAELQRLIMAL
ncbi:MAG: general stress protein CsbD [Flavobacteriales bacterium]